MINNQEEDEKLRELASYIPILSTIISFIFTGIVFKRYLRKGGLHLFWWSLGILTFGLGTLTESSVTLFGWNEPLFKSWYIVGAFLGGAPLAQGTAYFLLKRRTAHILTGIIVPYIIISSLFLTMSPINYELVEPNRLNSAVIVWSWVRLFSPWINIYAMVLLVGGAVLSAWRYRKNELHFSRFLGNVEIAIGSFLPGIGGTFTRFGYTEMLYITEFTGIILIYLGYRSCIKGRD